MIIDKKSLDLSKTSLLKGMQCPKALYLTKNPPLIEIPPDPDQEAKFRKGREVGVLARQLFPGGAEVPFSGLSFSEQVAKTHELMEAGVNVIYEGLDVSNGMMAMRVYHEMCETENPTKLEELQRGLLEYCRLDTLAMVKILDELKKMPGA